jgi:hypothetical protein
MSANTIFLDASTLTDNTNDFLKLDTDRLQKAYFGLISSYLTSPLNGTKTANFIDISEDFSQDREFYFEIKDYERIENLSSAEMFRGWKEGVYIGPKYSEWVKAYIHIWNKIHEPGSISEARA